MVAADATNASLPSMRDECQSWGRGGGGWTSLNRLLSYRGGQIDVVTGGVDMDLCPTRRVIQTSWCSNYETQINAIFPYFWSKQEQSKARLVKCRSAMDLALWREIVKLFCSIYSLKQALFTASNTIIIFVSIEFKKIVIVIGSKFYYKQNN